MHSQSFPPIEGPGARILILGSMPGQMSLQRQQYYAHPQNAFWKIMGALLGFAPDADYGVRVVALQSHGVALWDALQSCDRPGSADAAIDPATAQPNDIPALLLRQPGIGRIGFNGAAAEKFFRQWMGNALPESGVELVRLPSSSPAYAVMSLAQKTEAWRRLLRL
jgi:double-stranded uracil-DNA glycosylase